MATIETSSPAALPAAPPARPSEPLSVRRFAGVLSILGGLALWEFLSRFVVANALFLAAPTQIFAAIYSLAESGELWPHIGISAVEFVLGYVIASLLGILARHRDGRERSRQEGAAALDFRALCDADHRAGAAVHPVARHRHLVEGAGGDLPGAVPGRPSIPRPACAPPARGSSRCCAASARRRGRFSSSCRCPRRRRSSLPGSSSASGAASSASWSPSCSARAPGSAG